MKRRKLGPVLAAALLALVLALFCAQAAAESGSCGENLTWTLDDFGVLTIEGSGEMTRFTGVSSTPWYALRPRITEVVLENGAARVSEYAFSGCTGITCVTFLDNSGSLQEIGGGAFAGCSGLLQVRIASLDSWLGIRFEAADSNPLQYAEHLYYGDSELTDLVIPEGTEEIQSYAFIWDTGMRSVTFPESLRRIGDYAFRKCTGLQELHLPEGLAWLGANAFSGCSGLTELTVPGGADNPGGCAFDGCTGLTSVTLEAGREEIPKQFFNGCTSLRRAEIPGGVAEIGEHAFRDCGNLTEVGIPKSLSVIGDYAFSGCSALNRVTYAGYPAEWAAIRIGSVNEPLLRAERICLEQDPPQAGSGTCGNGVFWQLDQEGLLTVSGSGAMTEHPWEASRVKKVLIGNGVTEICDSAFEECTDLTLVNLPGSLTRIGDSAFYHCRALAGVVIPEGVTSLGYSSFYACGLKKIDLPGSVVQVYNHAFSGNRSLASATLRNGIQVLGMDAFYGCALSSVSIPGSVTSIGNGAFVENRGLREIVVAGNNKNYCSEGGVLFNRDKTELVFWPAGKQAEEYAVPQTVTRLHTHAFRCSRVRRIILPESVTDIDDGRAFSQAFGLVEITVSDANPSFSSAGGVLFSRDGETLILYPISNPDSVFTVPRNVKHIGDDTFFENLNLTEVVLPEGLLTIGRIAFGECENLRRIQLPDSLTLLGDGAFAGCKSLTEITLPSGIDEVEAGLFDGCTSLTEVVISHGITFIDWGAFYGCSSLRWVTIPDSVTAIEDYSFYGCGSLEEIRYTGSWDQWQQIVIGVENEALRLAGKRFNVELISVIATGSCGYDLIWKLDTAGTLTVTGTGPMTSHPWDLSKVKKAVIGEGVTRITAYAFENSPVLKSVYLPESLTEVGTYGFIICPALEEVHIASLESWLSIHFKDFYSRPNCRQGLRLYLGETELTEITVPEGISRINSFAFYGFCRLTEVTIPDGVWFIGDEAFHHCVSLQRIQLPESMDTIRVWAFSDCPCLTEITIPEGITVLNASVLNGCTALEEVRLPASLKTVGSRAFDGCGALRDVYYGGMQEQWDAVVIEETGNEALLNAAIHPAVGNPRTLVLPEDLVVLEAEAFAGNVSIQRVIIPSSLRIIGPRAFAGCAELGYVWLPASVTEVAEDAFANCPKLVLVREGD